jgi:hypothetical protein
MIPVINPTEKIPSIPGISKYTWLIISSASCRPTSHFASPPGDVFFPHDVLALQLPHPVPHGGASLDCLRYDPMNRRASSSVAVTAAIAIVNVFMATPQIKNCPT